MYEQKQELGLGIVQSKQKMTTGSSVNSQKGNPGREPSGKVTIAYLFHLADRNFTRTLYTFAFEVCVNLCRFYLKLVQEVEAF